MTEYRVEWQQYPYVQHVKHVLFVEANSADDAEELVRNHVERRLGIARSEFNVRCDGEAICPPPGHVREGQ